MGYTDDQVRQIISGKKLLPGESWGDFSGSAVANIPGSSRRAGGFSLVLRPTTTGGSFWEFDCFTVQKKSSFGTQSSPRRTFLAGRRSGRLEGRFPPARLLLPGGSPSVLFGTELAEMA